MKKTPTKKAFDHSGSSFDSFLEEEGIREEAGVSQLPLEVERRFSGLIR